MKQRVFIFILLTIVSPNLLAQDVKVITGATLIDGEGPAPLKDAAIIIEGSRIKQAGTDTGFSGVFPGVASHLELILHAEAGVKTADIIKAATINAARMIGREKDSGTIEEGKVADLLILDANPLDDIRNIKRIHRVVKSGTVFDPAELLKR
jgi:N-acetylglucosamine-6-phosphate deacetylase